MSTGIDIPGLEFAPRAARGAPNKTVGELTYTTHQLNDLPEIEEARQVGLLKSWEDLLDADPAGTLFQGPVWCMEWYRTYYQRYRPCMLLVSYGGSLVGLVPLAVERATGAMVFASANMSDYRDVLALPQHKQTVVTQFIHFFDTS